MTVAPDGPDRVVIISDYTRVRGGASKIALLLARKLQGESIPVTLFGGDLTETPTKATDGIDRAGVAGASLLEQSKGKAAMRGIWNAPARAALADLIKTRDTPRTIYHLHGFLQTLSPAILQALHPVRRRVVIHAHDYFLACPNGAYFDYRSGTECTRRPLSTACTLRNCDKRSAAQKLWRVVRQSVQNRMTRDLYRDSRIILLHKDMQPYLERGDRRILGPHVIPNPAQPFLSTPAQPARHRAFLFVGDIHTYKGVFVLAEAARKARVPLTFIGDGDERAALQTRYPEFEFAGWQDRQGLAALAGHARAVIVPSLGPEPFGLTLVEAIASGLPVVVADRALLAAEVEAAGAGKVFRAGDSDHLAQVLAKLASDDALVQQMSERAVSAGNRFAQSEDEWAARVIRLYGEMLQDISVSRPEVAHRDSHFPAKAS